MQEPSFAHAPGFERRSIDQDLPAAMAVPAPGHGVLPGRRAIQFYAAAHTDGRSMLVMVHRNAAGALGAAYFGLDIGMCRTLAKQMLAMADHLERAALDAEAPAREIDGRPA